MQLAKRTEGPQDDTWRPIGTAAQAVVERIDPRAAWLLVAACEYEAFAAGERDIGDAFRTARAAYHNWFRR